LKSKNIYVMMFLDNDARVHAGAKRKPTRCQLVGFLVFLFRVARPDHQAYYRLAHMNRLKIAMIQMKVLFDEWEKNLLHAAELVKNASEKGADICILPECLDLGWGNTKAQELAYPIPGKVSDAYCVIAKENHVYIVAGLTEKCGERVYNAALLISDQGEILHKHRKINVLTGVEDVYSIGDRIAVTEPPLGTIGIDICADNLTPSLSIGHTLARMGAQMILSPSAWAVTPDRDVIKEPYGLEWHVPYSELSGINRIPVIGVSNVGQVTDGAWNGWKAIGNSIAYDSDGKLLKVLPYGEDAECVDIVEVSIRKPEHAGTALAQYV